MILLAFIVLIFNCKNFVKTHSRIIGGKPATLDDFEGSISIQLANTGSHECGGTLVHESHVLTAASVVTNSVGMANDPNIYQLMGGDLSIQEPASPSRQLREAAYIFVHENYDAATKDNDIALIRTKKPFISSENFNPVPLPDASPPETEFCSIRSWGCTGNGSESMSPDLMKLKLEITPKKSCIEDECQELVRNGTLCAGNIDFQQDFCKGDLGAGLIYNDKVVGIASQSCAKTKISNVYTDVAHFKSWIELTIIKPSTTSTTPTTSTTTTTTTTTTATAASTTIQTSPGGAATISNSILFVVSVIVVILK